MTAILAETASAAAAPENPGDPLAAVLMLAALFAGMMGLCWMTSLRQRRERARLDLHMDRLEAGVAEVARQVARLADATERAASR